MSNQWDFIEGEGRLETTAKILSAISGREIEVRYGEAPSAYRIAPKSYFSRVMIPQRWYSRRHLIFLRGGLFHEALHVMWSDPQALEGITWALWLVSNALEDFRIELAAAVSWPGLESEVRLLRDSVLEFRVRQRGLSSSAQTLRIFDIAVGLYLILSDCPQNLVSETISAVPMAIALELLTPSVREQIRVAIATAQIVETAREILKQLESAAQTVATRLGTVAARQYASALTTELAKAQSITVEEMLSRIFAPKPLAGWCGPFYKGGPISFTPQVWAWPSVGASLHAPTQHQLLRWLLEIDPLREETSWLVNQRKGRLFPAAGILAQAAAGNERVMRRAEISRWLVLPSVLERFEFFIVVEAHSGYAAPIWALIQSNAVAIARLLTATQSRFAMRAFKATRRKVEKEYVNSQTQVKFTRTEYEYLVHIATIKAAKENWTTIAEARLADLSAEAREGFNIPLEYKTVVNYDFNFSKTVKRRVYIIFGDALVQQPWSTGVLNLGRGHLTYATAPLRQESSCLYVHCGQRLNAYDERLDELYRQFDTVVYANSPREAVTGIMRSLLFSLFQR